MSNTQTIKEKSQLRKLLINRGSIRKTKSIQHVLDRPQFMCINLLDVQTKNAKAKYRINPLAKIVKTITHCN